MLYLVVGVLDGADIDPTEEVRTRVCKLPLHIHLHSTNKVRHRLLSLQPGGTRG